MSTIDDRQEAGNVSAGSSQEKEGDQLVQAVTPEELLAKQVGKHLRPGGVQTFFLYRWDDVSGVSGTGVVAEGVRFGNGKCAVTWRGAVRSVTVYDSLEDVVRIHLHGGKTGLFWLSNQHDAGIAATQVRIPSQADYLGSVNFHVQQMARSRSAQELFDQIHRTMDPADWQD